MSNHDEYYYVNWMNTHDWQKTQVFKCEFATERSWLVMIGGENMPHEFVSFEAALQYATKDI